MLKQYPTISYIALLFQKIANSDTISYWGHHNNLKREEGNTRFQKKEWCNEDVQVLMKEYIKSYTDDEIIQQSFDVKSLKMLKSDDKKSYYWNHLEEIDDININIHAMNNGIIQTSLPEMYNIFENLSKAKDHIILFSIVLGEIFVENSLK